MINRFGFTLIELLVVIAIIGLLSSVVLVSLRTAFNKGGAAAATQEEQQIFSATNILYLDTGKGPNGCTTLGPVSGTQNEIKVTAESAGITTPPTTGSFTGGYDIDGNFIVCGWNSTIEWDGPYIGIPSLDPWGKSYWFDSDYYPYQDCAVGDVPLKGRAIACIYGGSRLRYSPDGTPNSPSCVISVVVSGGHNGLSGATDVDANGNPAYDCDDVFTNLVTGITHSP